jgi:hypothetical protein
LCFVEYEQPLTNELYIGIVDVNFVCYFYQNIVYFSGGYNYYGTEKMYSGIDGCEMKADIFFGIVHYQRLRHMVSDKWQVRALAIKLRQ